TQARVVAVSFAGLSQRQIAREVGADRETVSRILSQSEGLPVQAPVVGRFRLPALPRAVCLDDQPQPAGLRWLPIPSVADGRHDLPGYAEAADNVVPGDLVGDGAKEWGWCPGAAAHFGLGQLLHRLGQPTRHHGFTVKLVEVVQLP